MTSEPESSRRPLLSAGLLFLLPGLALMDSLFALAWGRWRPEGDVESGLLLLWGLWLGTGLALVAPGVRGAVGARWRELLLLFSVVMVGWLGLELGAHQIDKGLRPDIPFHTRGAELRSTVTTNTTDTPGIFGASQITTGPDGVRAVAPATPAQTLQVLCIGGSTTECVYLDDTETWPTLLGARTSALLETDALWVGNVGISGFYTRDHIEFVQQSPLAVRATAIVVQPGINDLWRFLAREESVMNYGRFKPEAAPTTAPKRLPKAPYRPRWTRSRVIQLFHTLRADAPAPEEEEGVGGREYQVRRARRAAAEQVATLPDLREGLAGYRARIGQLITECEKRDVAVMFTTQPVLWRDDLPEEVAALCWFGWLEDGRYLTLGALREAMDQYNGALRAVCEEAGVPCVDLSAMNGDPAWFYDDCHFTEAGAEEVADRVAPTLVDLLHR